MLLIRVVVGGGCVLRLVVMVQWVSVASLVVVIVVLLTQVLVKLVLVLLLCGRSGHCHHLVVVRRAQANFTHNSWCSGQCCGCCR